MVWLGWSTLFAGWPAPSNGVFGFAHAAVGSALTNDGTFSVDDTNYVINYANIGIWSYSDKVQLGIFTKYVKKNAIITLKAVPTNNAIFYGFFLPL